MLSADLHRDQAHTVKRYIQAKQKKKSTYYTLNACAHVCAGTMGAHRTALQLELWEAVSCPTWVLGAKSNTHYNLNHLVISLAMESMCMSVSEPQRPA